MVEVRANHLVVCEAVASCALLAAFGAALTCRRSALLGSGTRHSLSVFTIKWHLGQLWLGSQRRELLFVIELVNVWPGLVNAVCIMHTCNAVR